MMYYSSLNSKAIKCFCRSYRSVIDIGSVRGNIFLCVERQTLEKKIKILSGHLIFSLDKFYEFVPFVSINPYPNFVKICRKPFNIIIYYPNAIRKATV